MKKDTMKKNEQQRNDKGIYIKKKIYQRFQYVFESKYDFNKIKLT